MNICVVHDDEGNILSLLSPPREDVSVGPRQHVREVEVGDLDSESIELQDLQTRYRVDARRGALVRREGGE
jgi:hypothetical protein